MVKSGRHPIREKVQQTKFIPNDIYATQQSRFQIITGCNMSGKSTYIRSIALMSIMAQIGSFVPAQYATFPIQHQIFARVSTDDSIEANISTFAAEMREMAFILHNIDRRSIAIIDELGRGTSTRDGLAIALAIAEALRNRKALVWFVTHFTDLATILSERNGVINLHLKVEFQGEAIMKTLYKLGSGIAREPHQGLTIARIVPFPAAVIEHANQVSHVLGQRAKNKKRTSIRVAYERKRKLILNLREHLLQAQSGSLNGEVLRAWIKDLQNEFVRRMTAVDEEVSRAVGGSRIN